MGRQISGPDCPHCPGVGLRHAEETHDLQYVDYCPKCLRLFRIKVVVTEEVPRSYSVVGGGGYIQ